MNVVVGVLIWLFGSLVGVLLMCLASAASDADERLEEMGNKQEQEEQMDETT